MSFKRMFINLPSFKLPLRNNLFKHKLILGKILLLLVMLLSGITVFGCVGIRGTPEGGSGGVVVNGTLFLCPTLKQAGGFGCAAPATEGKLVAVDTSGGSRLWEVALGTSRPASGGFGCAPAPTPVAIYGNPAVAGDLVYVGGYNGKVYATNSGSGALRWVYPRQGNVEPIIGGVVAALGKVYFGCSDGKVYALDAADGYKEWEFPTGDKIWSTPTIDGDTLYIGSFDKKLYALSATDGSKRWEFKTEGAITSTPLVYDNLVYIGSFDRHLYAVNATNGKQIWRFPVEDEAKNKPENWFWAKPVICNNTVYAPCLDGKVYILNTETGAEVVDAIDLGSPISSSPVLVGNTIIIASEAGRVYALDTDNKQVKQLANVEAKVYAPLCASDGVIYIHTEAQILHALNAQTGARLWSLPLSSK